MSPYFPCFLLFLLLPATSFAVQGQVESAPPSIVSTAPVTLLTLKKEVRHLQRDLQSAVDNGAAALTPNGASAMGQALVLAHWCEARGTQMLKALEKLSGGRQVFDVDDASEEGRLQAEARAIVDGAQRLIQKLRREPAHLAEEGPMLPANDDVLNRYGSGK